MWMAGRVDLVLVLLLLPLLLLLLLMMMTTKMMGERCSSRAGRQVGDELFK
jgi:hypothetical protein